MTTTEDTMTDPRAVDGFTVAELQHLLASARQERDEANAELREETTLKLQAQDMLEMARANLVTARAELLTATGERDRLATSVREFADQRNRLTGEVTTLQHAVEEARAERDQARDSAAESHRNMMTYRDDRDAAVDTLTAVRAQVAQAQQELAEFKDKVVDTATKYASDHGWCSVVDDALSDMGLARKKTSYRATVQITVQFTANLREGVTELPSDNWVAGSMQTNAIERAITNSFAMDGDHRTVQVDDVEFEVTDVDDVSND